MSTVLITCNNRNTSLAVYLRGWLCGNTSQTVWTAVSRMSLATTVMTTSVKLRVQY